MNGLHANCKDCGKEERLKYALPKNPDTVEEKLLNEISLSIIRDLGKWTVCHGTGDLYCSCCSRKHIQSCHACN